MICVKEQSDCQECWEGNLMTVGSYGGSIPSLTALDHACAVLCATAEPELRMESHPTDVLNDTRCAAG